MATNQEIKDRIDAHFTDVLLAAEEQFGQLVFSIRRDDLLHVLKFLRDEPGLACDFLMDLFGVDYLEMGGPERFAVVYSLYSLQHGHRIRVRAWVPETDARIDSAAGLWQAANWAEREVFDLYGITFTGHPDLRRILCPDDFSGFPLRKDFPLQGIGYRENFVKIERSKSQ